MYGLEDFISRKPLLIIWKELRYISDTKATKFPNNGNLRTFNTNEGIIVDPGPVHTFKSQLERAGIKLTAIVNTHCHLDHVFGVAQTKREFNIPFYAHKGEQSLLETLNVHTANYGLPPIEDPEVDSWYEDRQVFKFGNCQIQIIHTPGHSKGSSCLYSEGHVVTGDTLFARSIGRTDLMGGDFDTIIDSIKNKLLTLPEESIVYPGHGSTSTIGDEKLKNPYLQD